MASIKKSKKKIIIPIIVVLIVAIISGTAVVAKQKASIEQVELYTIATDNITESVSATGQVSAGSSKAYKVATVANCKEVFVKVGDDVQKGDKLATFDTASIDNQINSLKATYNSANASYKNALKNEADARKKLKAVNKQIAPLEKKLAKLQGTTNKSTQTTKKATQTTKKTAQNTTKKAAQTTTTKSNKQTTTSATTTTKIKINETATAPVIYAPGDAIAGGFGDELDSITDSLKQIAETITQLTDNVATMNALLSLISDQITSMISSGVYSPDAIADACGNAMSKAIKEGLIDETTLIVESGIAVDMVEAAVESINWGSVSKSIENSDSVQLTSVQIQLAMLYAQRQIFSASASSTVSNAQKQVMNSTGDALKTLEESQKELSDGWVASMDGTVTECNLKPGFQTTALETGIMLEGLDSMVATISLGEYDIHKVDLGMKATVSTAYGKYTGEVVSIAPTATGGSSGSMLDSVGSMAGVSGLSSLASAGAGVECQVSIDSPDENIIAGFDADIEIQTGSFNDVPVVPIESIVLEKEGAYVYLYNEQEGTVTKTKIETGAISDSAYEIKDGIHVGDKIVSIPSSEYTEETFKVNVKK